MIIIFLKFLVVLNSQNFSPGQHPAFLTDQGRTRGVPNQKRFLHSRPSDRIGSNLTPTAKNLKLGAIREERIRRAREK